MSASKKKLKVNVIAGRNLAPKNSDNQNDPYCDISVLGHDGNKIAKSQQTRVVKGTLNPAWGHQMEFDVPSSFAGLKLSCWDKHKFRPDKFLGQATIKFNPALLASSESLDDWFPLSRRKPGETISGEIHLAIQYGDAAKSEPGDRAPLPQDLSVLNLKVGSAFTSDETAGRLKTATHVVVPEEDQSSPPSLPPPLHHPDSSPAAAAAGFGAAVENPREGPPTAALDRLGKEDKDLVFTQRNLEVVNNSAAGYGLQYAKGNVRVGPGRWYFEVRLVVAGSVQIGWCSSNYNPRTTVGDAWTYDGSLQQKKRNAEPGLPYGDPWTSGDIVGCLLDAGSMTIQYSLNGKDLGTAHTEVSSSSSRFLPLLGISRRSKVAVNFGATPFLYALPDATPLHSNLSEGEMEQLSRLFAKYQDLGNQELVQQAQEAAARAQPGTAGDEKREGQPPRPIEVEVELKDAVHGAGILQFQSDLGLTDDEDPSLLIIAWKLRCSKVWEVSRAEFLNGFNAHSCPSIERIRAKTREWRESLRDATLFKSFYNFVFDYLKEDKKILLIDEALLAWNIALKDRPWALLDKFLKFLRAENKKAISRDTWQQLLPFMLAYPADLKDYDAMASWPSIFDEFYEWLQKQRPDE